MLSINVICVGKLKEKFFKDGAYKFGLFSDVDYLITDREPNDEIKAALEKEDVIVIF